MGWLFGFVQSASLFFIFFERELVQSQPSNPDIYVARRAAPDLENERNTSGIQNRRLPEPTGHHF